MRAAAAGFTLVEVLTVCTLAGVLLTLAVPGWQAQLTKSRRSDAVAALMQLQAAQERFRAHHGLYTTDFVALQAPPRSSEGLYALAVELTGPDSYRAVATPLSGGAQAADRECPQLGLDVRSGFAQLAPSARCWNR